MTKTPSPLPFLSAMDTYISYLDRERTLTKGYSAPNSMDSYSYRLRALCSWMAKKHGMDPEKVRISDFTEEDIKNYLYECAKAGIKPKTLNARLYSFSPFWKWLNKQHGIPDITEEISGARIEQSKKRGITANHWLIISEKLEETALKESLSPLGYRNMVIFKIMRYFGRRIAEICSLNLDSITISAENMTLRYTGKGNQKFTKHLPFYSEEGKILFALKLRDQYKRYLSKCRPLIVLKGKDKKALFLSLKGTRITPRQVERLFKKLLKVCALQNEGYVPHSLRHGFARQKLDSGVSLRKVQKLMDHASIKTTEQYLDADEEELTEAMGKGVEED